jgi:hypothetical protein
MLCTVRCARNTEADAATQWKRNSEAIPTQPSQRRRTPLCRLQDPSLSFCTSHDHSSRMMRTRRIRTVGWGEFNGRRCDQGMEGARASAKASTRTGGAKQLWQRSVCSGCRLATATVEAHPVLMLPVILLLMSAPAASKVRTTFMWPRPAAAVSAVPLGIKRRSPGHEALRCWAAKFTHWQPTRSTRFGALWH